MEAFFCMVSSICQESSGSLTFWLYSRCSHNWCLTLLSNGSLPYKCNLMQTLGYFNTQRKTKMRLVGVGSESIFLLLVDSAVLMWFFLMENLLKQGSCFHKWVNIKQYCLQICLYGDNLHMIVLIQSLWQCYLRLTFLQLFPEWHYWLIFLQVYSIPAEFVSIKNFTKESYCNRWSLKQWDANFLCSLIECVLLVFRGQTMK